MTLSTLRPGPAVSRTVGTAAGSALALALLTCGCVFAALAGPALSLHTRSQALHHALAGYPNTTEAVQVSADWADFIGAVRNSQYGQPQPGQGLGPGALPRSTGDIAGGLASTPLPLAGGAWAGLTTSPLTITAGAAPSARAGAPPQLEVVYRDPFTSYARLVAGAYRSGQVPAGAVAVAATTQTAARFGLHPGSRLTLATKSGPATLFVTAIVRQRAAGSTFWRQDTTIVRPSLEQQRPSTPLYWVGGVIADPGQLAAIQDVFGGAGLDLQWEYPLDVSRVDADQAQGLYQALNRAVTTTPALTGALAPGANALLVTSPLRQDLSLFLTAQAAVETVLLLLLVSLVVVGAAVILLAARMIVARREGELTMLRARGGSLRQVAALMLRGAVVAAGPGVLIGAGLAIAVIPGGDPSFSSPGWPLAGVAIAAALAGPPLIAVWRHRRPAPARNPARITGAETRRPGPAVAPPGGRGHGGRRVRGRPGRPAPPGRARGRFGGRDGPVPGHRAGAGGHPGRRDHAEAVSAGRPRPARPVRTRSGRHRLRRAVPGGQVLADRRAARVRAGALAQPGHLRRDGQPGHHPRRDHRLLAQHRGGRADSAGPRVRAGHPGRGAGDQRRARRAARRAGLDDELVHAGRPAGDGGRGGPGRLRGHGRGHPVPRLPGGQDR